MFNIRREHLMISNNVHSQNVVGQYLSFHIKNRHQAILFQIDKANDHNSVCLLRGGISREDLPADLSDIGYPVNWYSMIWHNVTLHLFWRAIWGHIWKFNFDINSNIAVLIISFSVPAHAEQARHLHSRGCGRISPLVRFCSSVWPAWQNQCARHQPGNIIHIAKCKTDHIHIFICSFILWIPKTLLVMIVVPHILNVFFQEAPTGNSTIFRTLETDGLLESTQVEDGHLRLHLSESTIHTHSVVGEGNFCNVPFKNLDGTKYFSTMEWC